MDNLKGRRLEIRDYNAEVLDAVREYFLKYPKLPDVPDEESPIEKELREELEYLKLVLKK